MSVLVKCYLGFGCEIVPPPSPVPHLSSHFWVQIKSLALDSWVPCSQPASVYWVPTGSTASPWPPVWGAHGPDIPCPKSCLPTVPQGRMGLGQSCSDREAWWVVSRRMRWPGSLEFWGGWRGMRFWGVEFESVRVFVNSWSSTKQKKELPLSLVYTLVLAEWQEHPLSRIL